MQPVNFGCHCHLCDVRQFARATVAEDIAPGLPSRFRAEAVHQPGVRSSHNHVQPLRAFFHAYGYLRDASGQLSGASSHAEDILPLQPARVRSNGVRQPPIMQRHHVKAAAVLLSRHSHFCDVGKFAGSAASKDVAPQLPGGALGADGMRQTCFIQSHHVQSAGLRADRHLRDTCQFTGSAPWPATGVSPNTSGRTEDRLTGYFNAASLSSAPQFTFGNVSRTISFSGPGTRNFDISIMKTFTVMEKFKAQFRAEALNAFNHPLFNGPASAFGNANFGTITQQGNFPRYIQLGLRFMF